MTKQIYGKVLTTALLLGTAATGAHAQFTTTGTYVPTSTDGTARTVIPATGNTNSLALFQTSIVSAFAAGTGGDITFDNTSVPGTALANSVTATYGALAGSTLTITQNIPITATSGTGNYSTGVDLTPGPPQTSNATSGTNYFGYSNVVGGATYNYDFNFSQNLSDFGIMVINRGATRPVTFTVNLSNGTTVTPATAFPTSGNTNPANPVFFEYAPTGGLSITGVNLASNGYTRFDDLGFITAAPEPSQYAAFAIGILGVGMLALRARKRSLLA